MDIDIYIYIHVQVHIYSYIYTTYTIYLSMSSIYINISGQPDGFNPTIPEGGPIPLHRDTTRPPPPHART